MVEIAFGELYGWSDTTIKATPLILAGLGVSVAFRMRLWNIGAEGQLLIGAFWRPVWRCICCRRDAPAVVMLLAMALAGFAGGALWGFIPGLLKAKLNINEIITTLMLTYVAIQWNNYFVYGPWSERGFGLTPQFAQDGLDAAVHRFCRTDSLPCAASLPTSASSSLSSWPSCSGLSGDASNGASRSR